MTIKEALEILEIEHAKDKRTVKIAYRKLLPKYNPEQDEQGFIRLREAYDRLMKHVSMNELSELGEMVFSEVNDFEQTVDKKEQKKQEELCIEELVSTIQAMYTNPTDRNSVEKWKL